MLWALAACSSAREARSSKVAPNRSTISVNTRDAVGANRGIEVLREYFRGASWEWPLDDIVWSQLKPLGFNRLRLINVDDPGTEKTFVPPDRLISAITDCVRFNLKPHIVVGFRASQRFTRDLRSPAYAAFAYAFLEYVAVKRGVGTLDIEVGNEPDIGGMPWLAENGGARATYDAYLSNYITWAEAVMRLRREHPDVRVRVGGPAATSYPFGPGAFEWYEQFLTDVRLANVPLDFVSIHLYGNNTALREQESFGPYPSLAGHIERLRRAMLSSGFLRSTLYVTELGPDFRVTERGAKNATHVGTAWMAAALLQLLDPATA
jgi:xylan 1,4-beta-xylosidase